MRWLSFLILVLAALLVQVSICRPLGLGPQQVMPDLLVLLAVVLIFWGGGDDDVLAGCWVLGLAKDLSSAAPLGAYALSFGVMALLIRRLRELLYGQRLLPMMIITGLGSFLVEQTVFFLSVLKGDALSDRYGRLSTGMMFSALFTGALTPYVYWLVGKLHRQLGLGRGRSYLRG